jgi:hypothetical protein
MWREKLKPDSYLRKLFDSLPARTFIDIASLESFKIKHFACLYLLRPVINSVNVTFKEIGDLPFVQLELVLCEGVSIGYLLTSQKYQYRIGRNYALIERNKHKEEVSRLFVDNKFIVIGNDSSIVATCEPTYWLAA